MRSFLFCEMVACFREVDVTFEQPESWFWIILLVPVVFLALHRRKVRRVRVSSLFLWKDDLDSKQIRFGSRLPARLSLLLQILIVVCFLAAWSGPEWGSRSKAEGERALRLVLVIDNSPSMGTREEPGRGSRLERALRRAREWARWAREGRRVTVVTTAPRFRVRLQEARVASEVRMGLSGIEVAGTTGDDPLEVVRLVRNLAGRVPTRVVVLTDRVSSLLAAGSRPEGVEWEQVGRPVPNDGILTVRCVRNARGPGGALIVDLLCDGGEARSRRLEVREGQRVRYQETLDLVPGSEVIRHRVTLEELGTEHLEVLLEPGDALKRDDRFRVVLPAPKAVPVIVIGGAEQAFALEAALHALGDRIDRNASVRLETDPVGDSLGGARRLVVALDARGEPLPKTGVTLFLDPSILCRRLGIEIENVESPPKPIRVTHEPFWVGRANLHDLVVRRHQKLKSWPDLNPFVTTEEGHPLLLAEEGFGWLRVYVAFSLSESNLTALAAFPLLLEGLLDQVTRLNPDRVAASRDPLEMRLDPRMPETLGPPDLGAEVEDETKIDLRGLFLALAVFFLVTEWGLDLIRRDRIGDSERSGFIFRASSRR